MFSEAQESELGGILAQHYEVSLPIMDDPALAGILQAIADRLARHAPETQLHFRVALIDFPAANAFTLPGGYIYISRKLASIVRTEDELAGVVAHEMGHSLTHDSSTEFSRMLRAVTGVNSVSDAADIERKYNDFLDTLMRHPDRARMLRQERERGQIDADQIAVHLAARAGYSPQAFADFFDRLAEIKGRTGNWLTDLFGTTKPQSRRLREILKSLGTLPPGCIDSAAPLQDGFRAWQQRLTNYSGLGRVESLHNVYGKRELSPTLTSEITHLKFSPDGKYALAQDGASIFVLTRDPFAPLFRIDAPNAEPAHFTPDSRFVVFHTAALRVEKWSIADKQLESGQEVYTARGCLQHRLSPDGNVLACLQLHDNDDFSRLELQLLKVESGKGLLEPPLLQRGSVLVLLRLLGLTAGPANLVPLDFSPDGRFFVAGQYGHEFAYDFSRNSAVPLPGGVKKYLNDRFVFLASDRLVGVSGARGEKSAVLRFPSGEMLQGDIVLGATRPSAPTRGEYIIVRPLPNAPVGVVDPKTSKLLMTVKTPALDYYDDVFIAERRNGELGLYMVAGQKPIATVTLPRAPLGPLHAFALSPDLRYLAFSQRERGGAWDLNSGTRLDHMRGFLGAHIASDGVLRAVFPPASAYFRKSEPPKKDKTSETKEEEEHQSLAALDLHTNAATQMKAFDPKQRAWQFGRYLLVWTPKPGAESIAKDVDLEASDIVTGNKLWSKHFFSRPHFFGNDTGGTALLAWKLKEATVKTEIEADSELRDRVNTIRDKDGYMLVEVLDLSTGKIKGRFPFDTGKRWLRVISGIAAGDVALFADLQDRVNFYSFKGEKKGAVFGSKVALSPDGKLAAIQRGPGRLAVYDTADIHQRDQFTFANRVSYVEFSHDGRRILVLTDDQAVYMIDLAQPHATN